MFPHPRKTHPDASTSNHPDEFEGEALPFPGDPRIVQREQHNISRKHIDPDALKVMYRLIRHGYHGLLVGGGVRDLLLERKPKDFDVGTDARPEVVRKLFRNSRSIGRRFPIVHVFFAGGKIVEVATFRAESDPEAAPRKVDNIWGDPHSDALRRDLTINGLFYDPQSYSVVDYVDGLEDLRRGIIRVIGEPAQRFREDPVRMIRAVRHAARTRFAIEDATYEAICSCRGLLRNCPVARLYEEFRRELTGGYAVPSFEVMIASGLLEFLLPLLWIAVRRNQDQAWSRIEGVLDQVDSWVKDGREVPPAVVLAAVHIGLFDDAKLPRPEGGKDWGEDVEDYFRLVPRRLEPVLQPGAELPLDEPTKLRQHPAGVARVIDILCRPVGVPRKERELIEYLISTRYRLLLGVARGDRNISVSAAHQSELRMLLDLTASVLPDYFRMHVEQSLETAQGARGKRRRRRRQTPRRRKQAHDE